jgi:signal transduction histidine kinase
MTTVRTSPLLKRLIVILALSLGLTSAPANPQGTDPKGSETANAADALTRDRGGEVHLDVFGKQLRLKLSVGVLGITVILSLAILLGLALLFAAKARRRLREARTANRNLENEIQVRKRAEEEIQQLNANLESRVAERTQDVREANLQLAAMNTELESFSYSVSHDLRAPLRGIDGWSLALLEDYRERLDDRGREYLNRVRSETQRMGRLIDDLLKLSNVTRVDMQRGQVDVTSIAGGIAAQLREANPERDIEFTIMPGLRTCADAGLLQIVLTNLLSNSVKFTDGTSGARIEVGQNEQNGEPAFFVRDNGVGFDMAYAGTLFGAFQRLHKETEFPGTGIGLATVQRAVRRHGGRVWAEAKAGTGATFYFTIGSVQ